MDTEAMISFVMTLFTSFKRQCGDTFCLWPYKDCNRRGEFYYCEVLDLKRYVVPNFEEQITQICKNITEETYIPVERLRNDTIYQALGIGSACLNFILLFILLYCRIRRKVQKETIVLSEHTSEETKALEHVVESGTNIHRVCNQREDGTAKLLPSSNHNSYDIVDSGCSCCTSTKTTN